MIDEKAVQENLQEWFENPYWEEYYETAPSDTCKSFIALSFYYSETEDEEVGEAMDEMEKKLSLEDLEHLYKYATGPGKAKIAKMIQRMQN